MAKPMDLTASLVFFAISVGVCIEAHRLGFGSVVAPEPGFFPWIGGTMLAALSVGLFFRRARNTAGEESVPGEWRRPAFLLAALVLYVPLLEPLGYPVTTTALCVVALRILGTRRWSVTIGMSLTLALATFFLFNRALGVELPAGGLFFGR